jgi:hypothetical protein
MSIGIPRIKDKVSRSLTGTSADTAMAISDAYYNIVTVADNAQTLLLPPEAQGAECVISSTGAVALVVEEDSSTTAIATLATGEAQMFTCDGTTWHNTAIAVT